ncbi:hypothetical protein MetMK1DRAFT_00000050, partial [Metallosphaera yellowstonensis MK1]
MIEPKDIKVTRPKYSGDVLMSYVLKGIYEQYDVAFPKATLVRNEDGVFYNIEE